MGALWSSSMGLPESMNIRRKRRREEDNNEDDEFEKRMHTPKKMKIKSTSEYIFETLFVKGENSDVTIEALGKEWNLHKVYLCQSSYFSCMFNGSWKEANQRYIRLEIPDENITKESLHLVFGCLYHGEVSIKPMEVISVLASAVLLGLESLIKQCSCIIKENISLKTVCGYHAASITYGIKDATDLCFQWLLDNLMSTQAPELLHSLDNDLMFEIVSSPDLIVTQVEMDVYIMLKRWMFLKLHSSWSGEGKQLSFDADAFFKQHTKHMVFLLQDRGQGYLRVFSQLRFQHIICDHMSAKTLETDRIYPVEYFGAKYREQWMRMLRVEQGHDLGPSNISNEQFLENCSRLARILPREGEFCWRWTGYNYGIDFLFNHEFGILSVRRNSGQKKPYEGGISRQLKRNVAFRIRVMSLTSTGLVRELRTTKICQKDFKLDEEVMVLNTGTISFPIVVSANLLFYTPTCKTKVLAQEVSSRPNEEPTT